MKKQLLVLSLIAATSLSSFGQGWILFSASKNKGYDITSGAQVAGNPADSFAFLWSANSAATPGVGNAGTSSTASAPVTATSWASIMSDPNFQLAQNSTSGNAVAVITGNATANAGFNYNGGLSFPAVGTTTANIAIYVIGWNNAGGTLNTPAQAAAANATLGYSAVFVYAPGASSSSTPLPFASSGLGAFGIQNVQVPEPATFALAGLGMAAMLIARRRK